MSETPTPADELRFDAQRVRLKDSGDLTAVQWTGRIDLTRAVIGWIVMCGGRAEFVMPGASHPARDPDESPRPAFLVIHNSMGAHRVGIGDWIMRGMTGRFFPVTAEGYARDYEVVPGYEEVEGAEPPEQAAVGDVAPRVDTASSVHRVCQRTPGCARTDGHNESCALMVNTSESSARDKILAEVAESDLGTYKYAMPYQLCHTATDLANLPGEDAEGNAVVSRPNLVRAIALLVYAVERLDAGDE